MKLWRRGALAALAAGLALGVAGCRLELGSLAEQAQVFTPQQGQGGSGAAGVTPPVDAQLQGQAHGEGLGNVVDGHGYERSQEVGAPEPLQAGPAPAAAPAH